MIEAGERGELGGIWTVNTNYSFISTSNTNTNITLNKKFGNWIYDDKGIEARMPWITTQNSSNGAWLTTSTYFDSEWWGTLIANTDLSMNGWKPIPWMCGYRDSCVSSIAGTIYTITDSGRPSILWYWVR